MNEDDLMIFQEDSTGNWLVVERTDEISEFNTYLFDKSKELISNKKISTLFEKNISSAYEDFVLASNSAMKMYGINKTDVYIGELKDIEQELTLAKIEAKNKNVAFNNLMTWANKNIFDEADGLEGADIYKTYENQPIPIAILPKKAIIAFNNVKNRNIYSGKAYFIDHMVNHHDELDVTEYKNFQDDLDNFDKIYSDPKNGSIVFEKDKNNKKYSIAVKEDKEGNLVFYKSYHYGDKTKKRFIELDLEKLSQEKSVKVGNSLISHSDNSEPGSPLSALTDTLNITQTQKKSSNEKEIVSKSKFNNLAKEYNGLLKDYDENIKDYNNLLSAYNKSQEENQKLKNQLQSQNQKKNQNISR